jgi:hypothetical protein
MAGFPNQTLQKGLASFYLDGWISKPNLAKRAGLFLPGWLGFQTKPCKKGWPLFTWMAGFPNQTLQKGLTSFYLDGWGGAALNIEVGLGQALQYLQDGIQGKSCNKITKSFLYNFTIFIIFIVVIFPSFPYRMLSCSLCSLFSFLTLFFFRFSPSAVNFRNFRFSEKSR